MANVVRTKMILQELLSIYPVPRKYDRQECTLPACYSKRPPCFTHNYLLRFNSVSITQTTKGAIKSLCSYQLLSCFLLSSSLLYRLRGFFYYARLFSYHLFVCSTALTIAILSFCCHKLCTTLQTFLDFLRI